MKAFMLALIIFLPTVCMADGYELIINNDDKLCKNMLHLYNEDMRKYGHIEYCDHEEFHWVRWKKPQHKLLGLTGLDVLDRMPEHITTAVFDINNDGDDEVILLWLPSSSLRTWYDMYVFRKDDVLNAEGIAPNVPFEKAIIRARPRDGGVISMAQISDYVLSRFPLSLRRAIKKEKASGSDIYPLVLFDEF